MSGDAFGHPGIEPRWTRSDKEAIVCAYSTASPIWASLNSGIVTEVYFPTIDSPQIRDLQYLITDGETFFHDERRDTEKSIEGLDGESLSYRMLNRDPEGRYAIEKQILTAPHAACLLIRTRITVHKDWRDRLRFFALLAPHLNIGGYGNTAKLIRRHGRLILSAHRDGKALAMDCSCGFKRGSCGFVGQSDGWTDLHDNLQMDWEFDRAEDGNVALIGEIDRRAGDEFTLGLGFGYHPHGAIVALTESLAIPFETQRKNFVAQWARAFDDRDDSLADVSQDGGALFRLSHRLLLAHEDKIYKGATIASLSIPWGNARSDEDLGGYHLVWPRDAVHSATGLMAAGELATPLRSLIYLASLQNEDGGFPQNCWIDGRPYWKGVQLDEVAYPVLLAWRLKQAEALQQFDPYPMVRSAAIYLIQNGPATPQERWEEASGFSPSTLAVHIAALVCAADFAEHRGEDAWSRYCLDYADFLEQHIERWTVTNQGVLMPEETRHYIRILPVDPSKKIRPSDPDNERFCLSGLPADQQNCFAAKEIVDAGFLQLVRFGIRQPNDELIEASLRVVDHVLKVETPGGPCWHRYNHDGYGQRSDGGPRIDSGIGRAWPLLTGERGIYEMSANRDVQRYVAAMEFFAGPTGLLPEQVWDQPETPSDRLSFGKGIDCATPLCWAHAEYIRLLRGLRDGKPFDRIDIVHQRYCATDRSSRTRYEIWKFDSQPASLRRNETLRVQTQAPFRLRYTDSNWQTEHECQSQSPGYDLHYVDIVTDRSTGDRIEFTFWWPSEERWEGSDYQIEVEN
ncbi:MAG: glycoside hydrolase family 15 protein [Pirellulaceae bacterium]